MAVGGCENGHPGQMAALLWLWDTAVAPQPVAVATATTAAWLSWLMTEGHHSLMAVGVSPWWLWDQSRRAVGPEPHGCGWLWVAVIQQPHGRGARLRGGCGGYSSQPRAVERGCGAWLGSVAVVDVGRGCGACGPRLWMDVATATRLWMAVGGRDGCVRQTQA